MTRKLITIMLGLSVLHACQYTGTTVPTPEPGSVVLSNHLSNQQVNQITEDRYGHIWMATARGLNKFDGHDFHQYFSTDDTLGLPDNQINTLLNASDGKMWVGTSFGAAFLTEKGQFQRIHIPDNNRNILQLLESRDGHILFSNMGTLFVYDQEQEAARPVVRDFNPFNPAGSVITKDNRLWIISGGGFLLNCYNLRDYSLEASVPIPHQAYHLCEALEGDLWLSGMGRLSVLDTGSMTWKELPAAIRNEKRLMQGDIDILFKVDDSTLLMNVIGQGFFLYNKSSGRVIFQSDTQFPYEIPDTEVRSLFLDSNRNLWFGTADHGYSVSYQHKSQFGNKVLTQALAGKNVVSVCPDKAGNLWIATYRDGLYCYTLSSKTLQKIETAFLIPDSDVGYIRSSRVFCDSAGDLWLLFTEKMRVVHCRWDGRRLQPLDRIFAFNPMSIAEDDLGNVWISCFSQTLIRFERKTRHTDLISVAQEGKWTYVPDIIMKEPGRLLASVFNDVPVEVNTYTLEVTPVVVSKEDHEAAIRRSVLIPNKLFRDSAGNIWLGTLSNGLIYSDKESGRKTAVEGAPCTDICSIEEDRQGNIWVSTMDGLGKYDRTVGRFIHYFEEDGTGGDQYSVRASCILPDGTLVFGGTHGITWFNPLDTPAKRTVPLVFEDLTIHNQLVRPCAKGPVGKQLCEKPEIVIRHNQNAFNVSFAALDYSEVEQIRYAYRLEGFDKDWVKINTRHDAYFANLPAGNYRLHVRIANGSHTITETEESLAIRVLPPWYGTWWARLLFALAGLLLLGVIYWFYRRIRRVRKQAAAHIREVRRERERAEQEKEQEQRLNKIQMNYFANVAHEFRTPLTMIAGPVSQLAASEGVKGQDRQLVGIIQRSATWMLSLVNQLLDFNRIGNKKLQLKVAKGDIVAPLRGIADLFRFNAGSKGIELATYGLEDSFTMWADVDKVQKVVMNLLSNAMKFTPSGGRVTLGFDVIPREEAAAAFPLTEADTDSQYAQITVADTGCGIPEGQLEKIFERFYQADNQGDTQGSGIGLFYSRALTGMHHGFIKAENRPEGGAAFTVILPVSASSYTEDERSEVPPVYDIPAPVADVPAGTVEEGSRRRIAVVDDDIDIANYVKVLLGQSYNVSVYFDAASALKGMQDEVPDLVVSDVVMPGMSGYELCEAIKGDLQLSHIPVILVTAKVAVENQVQGLGKGADAYVTKPFQPAYLLALVKSLLENREKLHRQLGSVTTTEEIAPEALSPRDAAFMKELYELMEKELANVDLDITRITEMMRISRTKFYYKVKGLTGENPSVFFKRYKLNRAADLLKEGKHNMSEIAYMTGFNTLSHFSTSFKKQFGVPPSEYVG